MVLSFQELVLRPWRRANSRKVRRSAFLFPDDVADKTDARKRRLLIASDEKTDRTTNRPNN